jgi:hypothetical protein
MPVLELIEETKVGMADIGYCPAGSDESDHAQLVRDARSDRERLGFDVSESFVLCGRCRMLVPLECRVG